MKKLRAMEIFNNKYKPQLKNDWYNLEKEGEVFFRWSSRSSTLLLGETHNYDKLIINLISGTNQTRILKVIFDNNSRRIYPISNYPTSNNIIIPVKNVKICNFETDEILCPGLQHKNSTDNRELGFQFFSFTFIKDGSENLKLTINEIPMEGELIDGNEEVFISSIAKNITDVKFINIRNIETKISKGIYYIGQYGTCGYASAAKGYLCYFFMNNISITWDPLYFDNSVLCNDDFYDIIAKSLINKKIDDFDTVIFHCTPDLWPSFCIKYADKIKNKKLIGVAVWETSKLPDNWVECMNNSVHEVWCPSNYNKEVFENSGVKVTVRVVPYIFLSRSLVNKKQIQLNNILDNSIISSDEELYTFYTIGELNIRKGIEDIIKCYCEVFTDKDPVRLIIKTHHKDYSNINKAYCCDRINEIISKYKNVPRIYIIVDNLSEKDILNIHSIGDCYLSLCKSEGFGLTIFDAFNYGKKIIVTGYGGQIDFLGNNYGGLVKYKLDKVSGMEEFSKYYETDQEWAYPDLEHFKELLRKYVFV